MKSLNLEMVKVTEAGAIAAANWVGHGNKEAADKAATDAMRYRLNKIEFGAEIAIGEGIKDRSFGLFKGEKVGLYDEVKYTISIDPIEGTTPTAKGGYEAMSVLALGEKDAFFQTECFYMNKLAYGSNIKNKLKKQLSLTDSIETIVKVASTALERSVTFCMLDRPRHENIIKQLRNYDCRIKLIQDCDVSACIATCEPDSGIDIYLGVGGSPEGVISAAALKCMDGFIQCYLSDDKGTPQDGNLLEINDLTKGNVIFAATGITDGKLLKGVRYANRGTITHSIVMRSESGTVRKIETLHKD